MKRTRKHSTEDAAPAPAGSFTDDSGFVSFRLEDIALVPFGSEPLSPESSKHQVGHIQTYRGAFGQLLPALMMMSLA
jgi:hypothetical protein